MTRPPRLRFAPSPTGHLHVGGARTALFNWLYARRHGGVFVLRIEDTDADRSTPDMIAGIVESMRWLGLDWDEGPDVGGPHAPYFQSQRTDRHRAMAARLVRSGHAYFCYCAPETLKQKREDAQTRGETWNYDRACLKLAPAEVERLEAARTPRAIRYKVPAGVTQFRDLVHGPIEFDHSNIEDFVLLRSDDTPTYQLSVVADDIDMEITHVVRGDDHISNTPKQVLLYKALGAPLPQFAHVPLILGPDKKRLSKRHGATSVMEYPRLGYLPEAMFNFLALLGWSPGDDRELLTRDELVRAFSLEGISGGNAIFNREKLDWFNMQHMARLPVEDVAARLEPWLLEAGLWREEYRGSRRAWLHNVIDLLRPRVRRLTDFLAVGRPFFADRVELDPDAVKRHLSQPALHASIAALRAELALVDPFERGAIEQALRSTADATDVKAAALIHATRVAVTGQAVSPGLFEVLELVGRERALERLASAEKLIR